MTIHSSHPFLPPPEDRDPVRRLRGRLPAPVSVWTSSNGPIRGGWTISSMLVADGDPGELVALVNEDADWWDLFRKTRLACVNVLASRQSRVSEVFARVAPSPGGPFRTGEWVDSAYGPRLADAAAWVGVRLVDADPEHSGWGLLVRARIESVDLAEGRIALQHLGGHYS
ncbi:NADH-FMN oxidoreductase RutF, flavin reductase (DIM6/NTAB) family [Tessaracoccus bendigoensis DSM 12906]|uniref:NADH-FMN oxidoreductase RutF, flavin reductase (DIM6/NTAB) family n=1 Tax=Tessaracoccus bendigoensis DSM 12906 TaxID=1123357 RepID=A0A1M6BAF9_9ACTN|nr:flavin reductase [Tessaracoccus bendigoensis]SHI45719.1 NADH-FMN oxidoreductase RutF, flavin reductase (DIM6/NTAB) family [Tessaracoccus bendigoensis DSM 12906]